MTAPVSPPDPPEDAPSTRPRRPANGPIGVTRTELVWPGKYDEQGRLNTPPRVRLPFQTIETVGESRSTRQARKRRAPSLFEVYRGSEGETFQEGWKNKLIWGDNLLVMQSLLDEFAGKIDLIYIDPPFATGSDFSFSSEIGEDRQEVQKEPSAIEEKVYRDTWGSGVNSYLTMIWQRLLLMRQLLSAQGSIFLHCDWHVGHLLRSVSDEVLGANNFLNEIVWHYYNKFQGNVNRFASNHDVIYWYRRGEEYQFEKQVENRPEGKVRQLVRAWDKEKKAIVNVKGPDGKVMYRETTTRTVDDVWRISMLQPADRTENCRYPTQKPAALVSRILEAASRPGDLVADFFCGSGTTCIAAERLGRRWIGVDLGRWGVHVTRKRLLDIENCKPFTLLNLGKYERQHWQGVTFGRGGRKDEPTRAYYEYLAFILKLYGAAPIPRMDFLHGRKGRAFVHVGPVDAPVTISDVEGAINECARAQQKELHVLAWEWEMGLQSGTELQSGSLIQQIAKRLGVKLRLHQIPREVMEQQAADKGDIQFFELAYLEAKIVAGARPRERRVSLTDFVVPNPDSVPEDVRDKITKWTDWIDYWAVDWDFQHDSFMQGFVAYRTRKERKLDLVSDPHIYAELGRYRVLVKVVDIFGNDTSRAWDIEVP